MQTIIRLLFRRFDIFYIEINCLKNNRVITIYDDEIWINYHLFNEEYKEHWQWIKRAYSNDSDLTYNLENDYLPF